MWAVDSDSGTWSTCAASVNKRIWSASATKTTQLARRRTSARRRGSAPSSQASTRPSSVRAPRITSARRHPCARVRAELLVERDELRRRLDLLAERTDDLGRDPGRPARHGDVLEQGGDPPPHDVQAPLVRHEHRDAELVVADSGHGIVGAEELAKPPLGVVDEALGNQLPRNEPDLLEGREIDEEDRAARRQAGALLGRRGLDEPRGLRREETRGEDLEEVPLDPRGTTLEAEREAELAPVEVAEPKPATAREVELGRRFVSRRQPARLGEHVVRHPADRVDPDDAVTGPAGVAA